MEYTTTDLVAAALGGSAGPSFTADDYGAVVVSAANAWVTRKRAQAGYDDDTSPPGDDVAMGATLYAVALWRERAATDSYPSFEDMASGAFPTGSNAQIRRLLGIGRAAVDGPTDTEAASYRRRRRLSRVRW